MSQFNIEVRDKHYLQPPPDIRVIVDHISNGCNQFDDQFGHKISWRRFATKHKSAGNDINIRVLFNAIIQCDDMQDVQMLTFVFVQSFHLYIKH